MYVHRHTYTMAPNSGCLSAESLHTGICPRLMSASVCLADVGLVSANCYYTVLSLLLEYYSFFRLFAFNSSRTNYIWLTFHHPWAILERRNRSPLYYQATTTRDAPSPQRTPICRHCLATNRDSSRQRTDSHEQNSTTISRDPCRTESVTLK